MRKPDDALFFGVIGRFRPWKPLPVVETLYLTPTLPTTIKTLSQTPILGLSDMLEEIALLSLDTSIDKQINLFAPSLGVYVIVNVNDRTKF